MIRIREHQVWFASYVPLWGVPMHRLHNQQISLISPSQSQTVAASVHGAQLLVPRFEQVDGGGNKVPAAASHDDGAIHGSFPDAFA